MKAPTAFDWTEIHIGDPVGRRSHSEPPWAELVTIAGFVLFLVFLGCATDWQTVRVISGFLMGVVR